MAIEDAKVGSRQVAERETVVILLLKENKVTRGGLACRAEQVGKELRYWSSQYWFEAYCIMVRSLWI